MALRRRGLLALGAAAVAAVATGCRDERRAPDGARGPRSASPSPQQTQSPRRPRGFPGQPRHGELYYGASLPFHRSLSSWEARLGSTLSVNRSYFVPDRNETAQLLQQCGDDLAHGRLPHVSTKVPGTWRDVGTGDDDDWLTGILGPLGRHGGPVLLTVHHEPENDAGAAGMAAADYVGMQQRAIELAARLAPEVTIVPVLQQWTFAPVRHDANPTAWLVPEAAVFGLDLYNPWSATNGLEWRSFGSLVDEVLPFADGKPIVVGEYGCRDDPANPGLAAKWLRDAAAYARRHRVVAMSYFNSGLNTVDGSWKLLGRTERTFGDLLASEWVARAA
jgi:hypothetical protein